MNTPQDNASCQTNAGNPGPHSPDLSTWAKEWCQGTTYCPHCTSPALRRDHRASEHNRVTEIWSCRNRACGGIWKVEFVQTSVSIFHKSQDTDGEWVTFQDLDPQEGL
jgi:hypothetical protein